MAIKMLIPPQFFSQISCTFVDKPLIQNITEATHTNPFSQPITSDSDDIHCPIIILFISSVKLNSSTNCSYGELPR